MRNVRIVLLLAALAVAVMLYLPPRHAGATGFPELSPEEARVILHKGTERAFSGEYHDHKAVGTYTCKQCGAPLFRSADKFDSGTGWPSFDDAIPGVVREQPDGGRTEIVCANCDGHLGHVFRGEGFTSKNTRHCANSISLGFLPDVDARRAVFAGGCFWGVEHYFREVPGVISTTVGYTGGALDRPSYKEVSYTDTGHAEAMEVVYDANEISYEGLAKLFFEIHDPTQVNRQGPDIGKQYRSAVFYINDAQKETTEQLIGILENQGLKVATQVEPAQTFWPAETYHQDYYAKKHGTPYCHAWTQRFEDSPLAPAH